jgi:hypothetical protein
MFDDNVGAKVVSNHTSVCHLGHPPSPTVLSVTTQDDGSYLVTGSKGFAVPAPWRCSAYTWLAYRSSAINASSTQNSTYQKKFLSALEVAPNQKSQTYAQSFMCVHSVLVPNDELIDEPYDLKELFTLPL